MSAAHPTRATNGCAPRSTSKRRNARGSWIPAQISGLRHCAKIFGVSMRSFSRTRTPITSWALMICGDFRTRVARCRFMHQPKRWPIWSACLDSRSTRRDIDHPAARAAWRLGRERLSFLSRESKTCRLPKRLQCRTGCDCRPYLWCKSPDHRRAAGQTTSDTFECGAGAGNGQARKACGDLLYAHLPRSSAIRRIAALKRRTHRIRRAEAPFISRSPKAPLVASILHAFSTSASC